MYITDSAYNEKQGRDGMIFGILTGLTAATLMSVSYVFSKQFMLRHASPFLLTLFSQIVQGLCGAAVLICIHGKYDYALISDGALHWRHIARVVFPATVGILGNFAFFRTLKLLEASRLSSLLGLKIIMLGLICCVFRDERLSFLQWLGIFLATVAAVGMNFTGGRITLKAGFWLFLTLLGYALGDIAAADIILDMSGGHITIWHAFASTSLPAVLQGLFMIPFLLLKRVPKDLRTFADSAPYGVCWFASLLFLYPCFGILGVIFGTIMQSARGVISVLIGALLLKFGLEQYEPRVGTSAWIRRFFMALLMVGAMAVYAAAKAGI